MGRRLPSEIERAYVCCVVLSRLWPAGKRRPETVIGKAVRTRLPEFLSKRVRHIGVIMRTTTMPIDLKQRTK